MKLTTRIKTLKIFLLLSITVVLFISCEENVSPKGDLPNKYALNFVLRGDTSYQTLYISKVFDVDGFDPATLSTDPAVQGATVYLKYSDSDTKYYLKDTTDLQNLNTAYNTPAKFYYINNFIPIANKEIQITAQLPDGTILKSTSKTPTSLKFDDYESISYIPGSLVGRDTVYASVYWDNVPLDVVKAKRVKIVYFYTGLDGVKTKYVKNVPLKVDGENVDYNYFSFQNEVKIERKLLTKALQEISEGNSAKGRFSIAYLEVEVLTFDNNLTKYFSTNLFYDFGFTVRNYPADLTNIDGGLGYYGSYLSAIKILKFDSQWTKTTFGYLTEK